MESAAEGEKNEEPELNDSPNVPRRDGRPSIIGAGSDQI